MKIKAIKAIQNCSFKPEESVVTANSLAGFERRDFLTGLPKEEMILIWTIAHVIQIPQLARLPFLAMPKKAAQTPEVTGCVSAALDDGPTGSPEMWTITSSLFILQPDEHVLRRGRSMI